MCSSPRSELTVKGFTSMAHKMCTFLREKLFNCKIWTHHFPLTLIKKRKKGRYKLLFSHNPCSKGSAITLAKEARRVDQIVLGGEQFPNNKISEQLLRLGM